MYIAIYVSTIVLICAGAITFFIIKNEKNKKRGEILKQKVERDRIQEKKSIQQTNNGGGDIGQSLNQNPDFNGKEALEDFSINFEKDQKKPEKFNLNPFTLDGIKGELANPSDTFQSNQSNKMMMDDEDDEESEDEDLDKKFKEYEEFLRRNLDLDDSDFESNAGENQNDDFDDGMDFDDFDDEYVGNGRSRFPISGSSRMGMSDDDLAALKNFDYDSLKGKNEEEIAEIIKNLPPKAQEILMSDILARRDYDDEDF